MNSYWLEWDKNLKEMNPLDKDYEVDVCIIGAGITGLSTGYYLSKNELKILIIDKDNIGQKASGNTTAKITLQHNLIYDYLIKSYGKEFATGYFKVNKKAIENIKEIIDTENIDCDFEYVPNYVFATDQEETLKIQNEVNSINELAGEKYAQYVTECDLPIKISAAIKLENQAQFHPIKYMYGLAKAVENYGGQIFTNTVVTEVKKENGSYITYTDKYKIKSKYVVLASHYPFINFPGLYFSKMYQVTSYAMGVEVEGDLFNGTYINSKEPSLSFRTTQYGDKRLLIIAGANHKTGYSPDSEEFYGYKFLEKELKKIYPNSKIVYKWNTRDCISLDKIPYIGEFSSMMPNMYVATGFNKWGMTSSNVAANIITDGILRIDNNYANIFNSTRLKPIKNREELKNMVSQVFKSFVTNRIKISKEELSKIKNDNGAIIKIDDKAVGVYKDGKGKVYAVNPTCTHLGCLLTWNNLDKTWDCPCHGSRFNFIGQNLYDPAFKDLKKYEIE